MTSSVNVMEVQRNRGGQAYRMSCPQPGRQAVAAVAVSLVMMSGCTSGENGKQAGSAVGSDNHPPVVRSAVIVPSPLTLSEPLTVQVDAQDLDLDNISFRYRWSVNGHVVAGETKESFPVESLKRGDQVGVEVRPFDGKVEGAPFAVPAAVVGNTPPIVSRVRIYLDRQAQGRRLVADAEVIDPDHDPISVLYRWKKNDEVLAEGESNRLDVSAITAKDIIQVEVIARDTSPGEPTVVAGQLTLSNSMPTIVSQPPSAPNGGQYAYLVQATDPDDDPLTYALESAPPGMTINAQTGQINWAPSPETTGTYAVRIVAKDSKGGFASQEFELALSKPAEQS